MKSAAVKVGPGDKIRFSKIDPDDTGKMTKEEPHAPCRSTRWASSFSCRSNDPSFSSATVLPPDHKQLMMHV